MGLRYVSVVLWSVQAENIVHILLVHGTDPEELFEGAAHLVGGDSTRIVVVYHDKHLRNTDLLLLKR